jgi:hypothetical protein
MISAWWIVLAASVSGMVGFLIGAMCAVASDADDSFRARFAENLAAELSHENCVACGGADDVTCEECHATGTRK